MFNVRLLNWKPVACLKSVMCAPYNLETSSLLEIGDFSRKLLLHCSCQFLRCALALTLGLIKVNIILCL
jgi:hypothetical protein